jgi:uncharacterized protein YukE
MVTNVDLAALPQFASDLQELVGALRRHRARMEDSLHEIHTVWRDDTYTAHKKQVLELNRRVEAFERDCERMVDYLGRKHAAGMRVLRGW